MVYFSSDANTSLFYWANGEKAVESPTAKQPTNADQVWRHILMHRINSEQQANQPQSYVPSIQMKTILFTRNSEYVPVLFTIAYLRPMKMNACFVLSKNYNLNF